MPSVYHHHKTIWMLLALALGAFAGCQTQTPATPVPTDQTIDSVQDWYQQELPNAPIGRVVEVAADYQLAAVGNVVHLDRVKEGDRVTFVDINKEIVAHGHVARVNVPYVDVKYDSDSSRPPRQGDIMIKVSDSL